MRTLLVTYTLIIAAHGGLPTTWLRLREDDVITGTPQLTHMVTSAPSPITCGCTCRDFDWCSVFVADDLAGTCELRDLPRISLNLSSTFPHSSYWEVLAISDWCPVDDGFYFSAAARFCFIVFGNTTATWTNSRNECLHRGLDLVVPDTTLKITILLKILSNIPGSVDIQYYIGGSRPMKNLNSAWTGDAHLFNWVNGARVVDSLVGPFWAADQPNNVLNTQNCLAVDGRKDFLLNDNFCTEGHSFVCEKSHPLR
ncbi:hypothetical protein C0Q70_17777 [Pomacea canaliculata]|uniref:C-type lectin domain-containing protein n=2 Tax=Pomacea canaliculata TaxID=400727 RepID=A0A2T7NLD1_POMCA|nr:uncharacterized protein LOC112575606 isoform X1 [Pomacea canaliculata]XP_025113365.1 uncharacterized protein LOC112575606 isoform X1 [Pomacea canaliculata]PVD21974.1 hypothetical protein C0Q70_17777 [Pomacea canaliculata]